MRSHFVDAVAGACLVALFAIAAEASPRSAAAVAAFKREHPCPVTTSTRGPCPGWIVDHVEPLCAGGADGPRNMQWQPVIEAKAKDKQEWAQCRAIKKR